MGQCVARIQIEHSKTTADFPLPPLLSSPKSLFLFCRAGGWGRGKIGPFLSLSYYFWRHTTLFSCDMHPFSNPLFGSLRMQHPWNLDILFSETWRQRGNSSAREVAGGRAYWGRATVQVAGNGNSRWWPWAKSLLCSVPPGRSPGCRRWETYMTPDTRILSPAPGLRNGPLFFSFSVAFHTMPLPVSKMNSGSKLLQTST